jgi:hypothetical protein
VGNLTHDERTAIIDEEWAAALGDARLDAADVCLVLMVGPRPPTARFAIWHEPGEHIVPGLDVTPDAADRANEASCKPLHRVLLWSDFPATEVGVAMLAGFMRHELEHARQWNALGYTIFELDDLLTDVVLQKTGNVGGPGGVGGYYNFKPVEQDANAAASMYLRQRYPNRVHGLLADNDSSALVRSETPPEDTATLFARSFAFLFQHRGAFAAVVAPQTPLDRVEVMYPGYAALWRALEA